MLREIRLKKNLTQNQVAEKINHHRSYVSRLELTPSKCNPKINTLIRLALILEINGADIFEYFLVSKKNSVFLIDPTKGDDENNKKRKGKRKPKNKDKNEQ